MCWEHTQNNVRLITVSSGCLLNRDRPYLNAPEANRVKLEESSSHTFHFMLVCRIGFAGDLLTVFCIPTCTCITAYSFY